MITFSVLGTPAPQGSKRFIGHAKSGRGILVESSKAVKPWREAVKYAAHEAMAGRPPLEGPLDLTVVFILKRPKRKNAHWPDRRPDLSKCIRATEDALTDAGVWRDDAQVVQVTAKKVYAGPDSPGAKITIKSIDAQREHSLYDELAPLLDPDYEGAHRITKSYDT